MFKLISVHCFLGFVAGFGVFSLEQNVFKIDGVSFLGTVRDTLHLLLPWPCPCKCHISHGVTRGDSPTHRGGVSAFMGIISQH